MAFMVGGSLCALAQTLYDRTRLTMAHVMVLFVVMGSVLTGIGVYDGLIRIGGAGAMVPVSNFGFVLTKGILHHMETRGLFGTLSGVFEFAGGALAATVFFGLAAAVFFRAKG